MPTARLIDPFSIFQHAVGLLTVDEFIRDQAPARADFAYTSMLLEAFAVELLLKCLLIIEKKDPPTTHRLDKLFRQISHKKKRRLEELGEVQARQELTAIAKANGLPSGRPTDSSQRYRQMPRRVRSASLPLRRAKSSLVLSGWATPPLDWGNPGDEARMAISAGAKGSTLLCR